MDIRARLLRNAILAVLTVTAASCVKEKRNPDVAPYGTYAEGLISSIEPEGWIKEFLGRQIDGLTGHKDALAYPYDTDMWMGETQRVGDWGCDWWRFEQTAYFTDGAMRTGYLTGETSLLDIASRSLDYTLGTVDENGELAVNAEHVLWPFAVFFRALQAAYEATGDVRIIPALERHYSSFPGRINIVEDREILTIEGMLWTYGKTGDKALLDFARDSWDQGGFPLDEKDCWNDAPIDQHGVTYCEHLKLPMLLYAYTGEEKYLNAALHAQEKLEKYHLLPDGVPSSGEDLMGNGSLASHETCDISDYSWTMGHFLLATGEARWGDAIERAVFNAGVGAVTKDFKAFQYFSAPNQFISTGISDHNRYSHGRCKMAYRATHQTECCAGNVQRFMPNYVSRMWLEGSSEDEIVAALYGPCSVSRVLPSGHTVKIHEGTEYPFEDEVRFTFDLKVSERFAFSFRIPGWCDGKVSARINGHKAAVKDNGKGFATISRKWKDGDILVLDFGFESRIVNFESNDAEGRLPEGNESSYPMTAADSLCRYSYVTRGPLLFSYAIPSKWEEDNEDWFYMNGKKPGLPGYTCWNITPSAPWNYAIVSGAAPEFIRKDTEGFPFDPQTSRCSIRVPVRKVKGWALDEDRYTSRVPYSFELEGSTEYIELIPYGCTNLRLTLFPWNQDQ
ncbi:MAG: glycoside hydrolase family 127 protein [Bacteroidales bacterium]|nr:glycoside hydrolase family 127 protein [Candidatus Cryptobacteroides onthequi]